MHPLCLHPRFVFCGQEVGHRHFGNDAPMRSWEVSTSFRAQAQAFCLIFVHPRPHWSEEVIWILLLES